jgi:hypothetical protein
MAEVNDWPSTLPPLALGTAVDFGDASWREPTAIGPPIVRPRFTAIPDVFRVPQKLSATQLSTLRDFYKVTLEQGALRFNHTDPVTLATVSVQFTKPPAGFVGIVGSSDAGTRRYSGTIELRVMP